MTGSSWAPAVFDRLYAADPDPWRFETSPYERNKYAATLAALPPERCFANALELGCSIGVFTALLAPRCAALLAVDAAPLALDRAVSRCRALRQVRFGQGVLPDAFPDGRFDLVVVSELLYFLCPADIDALAARIGTALTADGLVLLVNWTGATDTPCTGEEAAERFRSASAETLTPRRCWRRETYRLDLLEARPDGSAP